MARLDRDDHLKSHLRPIKSNQPAKRLSSDCGRNLLAVRQHSNTATLHHRTTANTHVIDILIHMEEKNSITQVR